MSKLLSLRERFHLVGLVHTCLARIARTSGPGYPSPRLVPIAVIRDAISRSLADLDPFKVL